jgi:hypothetical protein
MPRVPILKISIGNYIDYAISLENNEHHLIIIPIIKDIKVNPQCSSNKKYELFF